MTEGSTDDKPILADLGGWSAVLGSLTDGVDLTVAHAQAAMAEILAGNAEESQIAGLLIGLKAKGETVEELTGLARAMMEASEPLTVPADAIDIVGTGGSEHRRRHALNVSTMACIVAAAAGAVVCKHGNRKASSTSGSFDFLEALGAAIELGPDELQACIAATDLGFAFARAYHPAMRFAGPVRTALGIPTVFNLLGPLANPGRVTRQVVGVSSPERAESIAMALAELGSSSAWVVAGAGGLDELSTTGDNVIFTVSPAGVERTSIKLDDLGISTVELDDLIGGDASANVTVFERILSGENGPHRDIVLLNAGAGLVVAGLAVTLSEGIALAAAAVDDGRAAAKTEQLREVTNRLVGSS